MAHERLEGIFGPADIRKEAAGIKKLWHYGVDGLVGYSDDRLREILGRISRRSKASGVKKLWHYGVDGKDGLVGYSDLHRGVRTAKAAAQGRSTEGLIGREKNDLAQQHSLRCTLSG